jgi:AcrR family transcriptional regulator
LVEHEGPEALTMRRLGEVVGMRAPSLYKHLPGKSAVTGAVVELAMRDLGAALHEAVADETGPRSVRIGRLLSAYRAQALASPHLYRLATSGTLFRDQLSPGVEDWAGEPFWLVTGEPYVAQALWSAAHGTVILELDGRYPPGSELDRTWAALAAAFGSAAA